MSALHSIADAGDEAVPADEDAVFAAASSFLARLWCADAHGALTDVHMIAEKTPAGWIHHPVYTAHDAASQAWEVSARGRDAYFACGAYSTFNGSSQGNRTKANALGASCLWLDLDCGEDKAYPDKGAALVALRDFCKSTALPKPSFFVNSGNGLHIYWQFSELIEKELWRTAAHSLKELANVERLKADPSRTADIASVLRVPGTCNWKDSTSPKRVSILSTSAERDLKAFLSALEAAAQARSGGSASTTALPVGNADNLGENTGHAELPPPPIATMRAMLKHLAAQNCFERRTGVARHADGRVIKVGWIETGMALKPAYGDEVGFDLWSATHIDDQAQADAPGQWASFAAEAQPGHITIGTIIKAAKDGGFVFASQRADHAASGHLSYGPFTMNADDGLTKEVIIGRGKNSAPEPVWISAPFEILGQCRDPHGRAWGKQIRFRDGDGRAHVRHVSDAALHGEPAALCGELADEGMRINRSRQKELAEYLGGVVVDERVTKVGRTGWHQVEGHPVFVLPAETISAGVGERVALDAMVQGPYEARGSLEDWKQGVGALTAGHVLPVFMVSAALAGPLVSLVGAEGGGVHVFGQSSIGKSAMLAAGASVWGRGGTPGYVRSWRATANGLEGAAASATDTCLVLDELGVGEARDVAASVYALANGSGKQRARRDGSAQEPRGWRVFVLSSGELPVEAKIGEDHGRRTRAGQAIRLLDVQADRALGFGAFDNGGDSGNAGRLADAVKEAARSAYGTAGPEFVRRLLASNIEPIVAWARGRMDGFIRKFVAPGSSEQIARAAKKFALIAIAGEVATALKVTPWETGEAGKGAQWAFDRWIETRGGAGSHEEREAIEQVRLMIGRHGGSRFERVDVLSPNLGGALIVRDRLGWVKGEGDKREWWVPPEIWKAEVCNGLDPVSVARTLASRGMLRRQGDGRNLTCVVAIPGGQKARCYVLTADILGE